jgi:hypothetical protein
MKADTCRGHSHQLPVGGLAKTDFCVFSYVVRLTAGPRCQTAYWLAGRQRSPAFAVRRMVHCLYLCDATSHCALLICIMPLRRLIALYALDGQVRLLRLSSGVVGKGGDAAVPRSHDAGHVLRQ